MTTGDVVYSLRFSLIKILPEPGFDLGSTAGESCVLTARLHMLDHKCDHKCDIDINIYRYPVFVYGRVESSRVENSVAHGYKYI